MRHPAGPPATGRKPPACPNGGNTAPKNGPKSSKESGEQGDDGGERGEGVRARAGAGKLTDLGSARRRRRCDEDDGAAANTQKDSIPRPCRAFNPRNAGPPCVSLGRPRCGRRGPRGHPLPPLRAGQVPLRSFAPL
ncbi:hypothetical protein M758_3G109200 [Ceratodon purpureus]|nr:hypothetical protein M758_3G109100 [Ceratodon purpureus]KAG0622588.1 hypothetical protein M758_3G109200 [Ceratodon purpureus]